MQDLRSLPNNPRKIVGEAFDKLKERIQARGFHDVLKVDTEGYVLSGNQRKRALTDLGIQEVTVLVPSRELTKEERDKIILESNRNDGIWDMDMLANEFDLETLLDVGFLEKELDISLSSTEEEPSVPAMGAEAKSARGDLYIMGEHRLLCGDSTDLDDVGKLMDGKKSNMVFTDPPWKVAIGLDSNPRHRQREGLINDDLGEDFPEFLQKTAVSISQFNTGDIYCVMGCEEWPTIHKALTEADLHWSSTIVWVKDQFVLGRSKYHRRYEPIWYGWPSKSSYVGDRAQDDVWEMPRPKTSEEHPTMKPIALVEKAIMNSSNRGEIVLDLFLGSGTTLLAAHNAGRICYGIELDPKYVDVIVKRWEEHTGLKAEKVDSL